MVHRLSKAFRTYNLVIRNYRNQTSAPTLAAIFAFQCLVSSFVISIGVALYAGPLSLVLTILGILGLANTLYVHLPNIHNP